MSQSGAGFWSAFAGGEKEEEEAWSRFLAQFKTVGQQEVATSLWYSTYIFLNLLEIRSSSRAAILESVEEAYGSYVLLSM